MIYLDNNATAAPAPTVITAVEQALTSYWANPSSVHGPGQAVSRRVTKAREQVARLFRVKADHIVFTSGATEANEAVLRDHAKHGATLFTSSAEHPAVTGFYLRNFPSRVHLIPVDDQGRWQTDTLEKSLAENDAPSLVALAWANGETGVLQDAAAICAVAKRYGAVCLVDASQAIGRIIDLEAFRPDYLTFSGHKLHGPKGIGVLVQPAEPSIVLAVGGGQERGWRGGTENVPGIIGLGVACALRSGDLEGAVDHMARLRDRFEAIVLAALPDACINGLNARRISNTSSFTFPGVDGIALVARLEALGILCSQVSACSSARPEPSQTLLAMGRSHEDAFSSVRFAVCVDNSDAEVEVAAQAVIDEVRFIREYMGGDRMKLGGHETFYPRPGWLTKGLLYLSKGGAGVFSLPETADRLGVGRNMAKSIGWWLDSTGLAARTKRNPLLLTSFGELVAERDPYMLQLGTWWLLHAAAMTPRAETSLPWFFSPRRADRCHRTVLVETLLQHLSSAKGRTPVVKTIQREVAAVMQTYAVPVPHPRRDPEDNLGSPFYRLDLWRHLRAADRFERSQPTPMPPEALGLILSALSMNEPSGDLQEGVLQDVDVRSGAITRAGAMLGRSREALLDLAGSGERELGASVMAIRTLAGDRFISVLSATATTWAKRFYERVGCGAREAAT